MDVSLRFGRGVIHKNNILFSMEHCKLEIEKRGYPAMKYPRVAKNCRGGAGRVSHGAAKNW